MNWTPVELFDPRAYPYREELGSLDEETPGTGQTLMIMSAWGSELSKAADDDLRAVLVFQAAQEFVNKVASLGVDVISLMRWMVDDQREDIMWQVYGDGKDVVATVGR